MPNNVQPPGHTETDAQEVDVELFRRAHDGDEEARSQLVERHWNLIWHIVHRFSGRGHDADDLFQVGAIGLLKAIARFDVDRGLKFSTYAVPLILGEIRRYLRDDQPIRVARSLRETGMRVEQARTQLSQKLGRDPTAAEISQELGVDTATVTEALEAVQPLTSLNQGMDTPHGTETRLLDNLPDPTSESEWLEQMSLTEAFKALDSREQYILRMRFGEGRTQAEVARRLHVSQVQVSRLERRALNRLKIALSDHDASPSTSPSE